MNRSLKILKYLEASFAMTGKQLAEELGVTPKTISNEIVAINKAFEGVAEITFAQGIYRIVLFDRAGYEIRKATLTVAAESFNSTEARQAYIFERLASSYSPLLVDFLASEMSVSRSTVNQDLSKLREALTPYNVLISGRPNSGIELEGEELSLRMAILDLFYNRLYQVSPLPAQVAEIAQQIAQNYGLQRAAVDSLIRWLVVLVDRVSKYSSIQQLPQEFEGIRQNAAFEIAQELVSILAQHVDCEISSSEVFYMALPLIAMRGQDNQKALAGFLSEVDSNQLVQKITDRIYSQMGLHFTFNKLAEEFRVHIGFLTNRIRFGIQVASSAHGITEDRYPLAFELASVAQKVIEEETAGKLSKAEISLLAVYFQVNLEEIYRTARAAIQIAVIYPYGKVDGFMLAQQIESALPGTGKIKIFSREEATEESLKNFDVIVLKEGTDNPSTSPSIVVADSFDVQEFRKKIDAICIEMTLGARVAFGGASWIATLISRDAFFVLSTEDYENNLVELLEKLKQKKLVTEKFESLLFDHEVQSTMQITEILSFPHTTNTEDQLFISLGVRRFTETSPGHLMILAALPQKEKNESATLVGLYQEVMRIARAPNLVQQITELSNADQFKSYMITHGNELLKEN